MVACRDDGDGWSFYLLNDNDFSLDEAVLYEVSYEWGDWGNTESADVHVTELAPGGHAQVWRDGGSGVELRMEFYLRIRRSGRTAQMKFEFPKLYRKKDIPLVKNLDRLGWEEFGEARLH
jgi:hypothetical protein